MKTVTIHEAKTHLSRLIRDVIEGDEIVIARGKTPVVRLTLVEPDAGRRRIGAAKGMVVEIRPGFDDSLEDFADYR